MVRTWIGGATAAEIAASVERGFHLGRVGADDPLPTVRELAAALRVSPATVAAAYKLLRARGLLRGQGRQGTRMAASPRGAAGLAPVVPAGTVDLATGGPDPLLLPPFEPALRVLQPAQRLYSDDASYRPLVAFAASEFEADGIPARSVTVLSGGLDAIERVLREHLRPGDRVAVEDPGFPGIADLARASGLVPLPCRVDQHGPVPADLERALRQQCAAVVVTPRAQNPTGAALDAHRVAELRKLLRGWPAVLLIENDYAGPISGSPAATLVERSRGHWAVVRSMSKSLGPDLRVAVMAADEMTAARVQGRQALGARWVSHLLQALALALWSDPASGRRLARAVDVYAHRRQSLVDSLSARGIRTHAPSGFNVWVPVRDEASVVRGLADRGWAVMPGERFRLSAPPGIRVTVSTLPPSEAERFADDLALALEPGRGGYA